MGLSNRVERIEAQTGRAGTCELCERRAEPAPRRTFGPEWEVTRFLETSVECPNCGRPREVTRLLVVYEGKKPDARKGATS
jgi:hypothetical protein